MGGMAIALAFSSLSNFGLLAENGASDSAFIKMMAAFFHFVLIQSMAILLAIVTMAYPTIWISGATFFIFSYAILVGLATAGQLLTVGQVLNFAQSIPKAPGGSSSGEEGTSSSSEG